MIRTNELQENNIIVKYFDFDFFMCNFCVGLCFHVNYVIWLALAAAVTESETVLGLKNTPLLVSV